VDTLLIVADQDPFVGKVFRLPTDEEREVAATASERLAAEKPFGPLLPAVPIEEIAPGNNNIIGPSIYGAVTYGDLMCDRQTLGFVRLARVISDIGNEIALVGMSGDYVKALTGYAAAQMVRKLKYSTRGAAIQIMKDGGVKVNHIFVNEGSLAFSYDFFETGIGEGPGTWASFTSSGVSILKGLMPERVGEPTDVIRGSATDLPFRINRFTCVVTDPPYDEMIAYCDSSDLFYVWLKRALASADPLFLVTSDPHGTQEKAQEIIVKRVRGEAPQEHRTREHYDAHIGDNA
jgi:adenine-specific DNA methylase